VTSGNRLRCRASWLKQSGRILPPAIVPISADRRHVDGSAVVAWIMSALSRVVRMVARCRGVVARAKHSIRVVLGDISGRNGRCCRAVASVPGLNTDFRGPLTVTGN
jgi:hypothetical protein